MEEIQSKYDREKKAGLLDKHSAQAYLATLQTMEGYVQAAKATGLREKDDVFGMMKEKFAHVVEDRENAISYASAALDNAFAFLEEAFGAGQEMVIFITELTANYYSCLLYTS